MNGLSSSSGRNPQQQSSLDALSRTIEGLEARIESLVTRSATGARSNRATPAEGGREDVSEIVQRQKLLDQERSRLRSRLDRATAGVAAGSTSAESERTLQDIADALIGLRTELRRDIGEGLAGELSALRREIAALKGPADTQALPPELRTDLMRLAECIERLSERTGSADAAELRNEIDALRTTIEGVVADASSRTLEHHWEWFESRLADFAPETLKAEIAGLADRIEVLGAALSELPGSLQTSELERRLTELAGVVEKVARNSRSDALPFEEAFAELGDRLDEISRAIVAAGARNDRRSEEQALARLESRVAGIARQIDGLSERDPAADIAAMVEALAARIDQLAGAENVDRLGDHIEQLSTLLADNAGNTDLAEITGHLADISTRIDALEQGALSAALVERLDALGAKIDELAGSAAPSGIDEQAFGRLEALVQRAETTIAPSGIAGIEVLEERLADIARRLDETQNGAPGSEQALRSLEAQIANLSDLMSHGGAAPGEGYAILEPRLVAIEEHLATNDEYVIEAARQAAEAVIEAYGRGSAGGATAGSGDLAVISELAEDLRALEELSRESDQRTARAFDAVHDTLVKIAEHLEKLEPARPAAAALPGAIPNEVVADARETIGEPERHGEIGRAARQSLTPAAAAAEAAVFAASSPAEPEDDEAGAEHTGFFAGLGKRVRGQSREPVIGEEENASRRDVGDAPSIDPSESFDPVSENEPLEPGSGAPDIARIIQKVREVQAGDGRETGRSEAEKADFIAAARRAAQAAAAEVETIGGDAKRRKGRGLADILKRRRRPILMAVGAVLLAVMSWPLVSPFLGGTPARNVAAETSTPAVVEKAEGTPAVSMPERPAPADAEALPEVRVLAEQASKAPPPADHATTETAAPSIDHAATASTRSQPAEAKPAEEETVAPGTMAPAAAHSATGIEGPAYTGEVPTQISSAEPERKASVPAIEPAESGDAAAMQAAEPAAPAAAETASAKMDAGALPAVPETIGPASLRAAAEKGDPIALFEIGARFTQGRGVDVDLAAAVQWYKAAAERGLAPAEYRLANLYEKGSGIERNVEAAKNWYRKAAEAGNVSAMHNLAVLNAMGTEGTADYEAAAEWFEKAAAHGVHDSQFNLGILYAQGHGVPRDLTKSYKWFAIAAGSGDKDAAEKRDQVAAALDADALAKAKAEAESWKARPTDPAANAVDIPAEWSGKDTHTASVDMTKAIRNIQAILNNNGFDAGPPDGIMGEKTRMAIKAFQKSVGQEPTGELTDALVRELLDRNAAATKT